MDKARRILVIDDHAIIAEGCQYRLERAGRDWTAQWSTSTAQAEDLDDYDLVILDLRLADNSTPRDNIRLLTDHDLPVVVYTSADDPVLVREAIAAGVLAVVRKSSPSEDLIEAVDAALSGTPTAGPDWASAVDSDGDFAEEMLTEGERLVLARYAMGEKSQKVARALGLTDNTVNTYVARIRSKYRDTGRRADTRVDLFRRAAEDGLISYYE